MGIEGDVPKQQYDLGWFGMDLFLLGILRKCYVSVGYEAWYQVYLSNVWLESVRVVIGHKFWKMISYKLSVISSEYFLVENL